MAHVHPIQNGAGDRVFGDLFLQGDRGIFQVHSDGGCEELDVGDLFGCGVQQHVAILCWTV